jgi:hypothetical protein
VVKVDNGDLAESDLEEAESDWGTREKVLSELMLITFLARRGAEKDWPDARGSAGGSRDGLRAGETGLVARLSAETSGSGEAWQSGPGVLPTGDWRPWDSRGDRVSLSAREALREVMKEPSELRRGGL